MTALGARNPLPCQTIPVLSTVLALLAHSDVLTIPSGWKLEQLFFIMRIAAELSSLYLWYYMAGIFLKLPFRPVTVTLNY